MGSADIHRVSSPEVIPPGEQSTGHAPVAVQKLRNRTNRRPTKVGNSILTTRVISTLTRAH